MIPRPEHPNPQFVREKWINLNGVWEFETDPGRSGKDRAWYKRESLAEKITVPFCPESKLSGIGNTDFMEAVWYKRSFRVPEEWKDGRVFLHFGAVDYEATVYINGKEAGTHRGGYTPFATEITAFLQDGENTVVVCAEDDTRDGRQPSGKQSSVYHSHGCSYTRITGIWQTVWLEYRPESYIESVRFYPDVENGTVTVETVLQGTGMLHAAITYEGRPAGEATAKGVGTVRFTVPLSEIQLWEPGHGRLYDVELTFGADKVRSYFGLRSVRLDGMKFLINGKSVFQRLVLDQGYYPDGLYTAPDTAAMERDIRIALEAGFNGARLHEKVFEPLFLYYCDVYGYIVWGEYPNWGFDHSDIRGTSQYIEEWREAVLRDVSHPSIVGWCPFNETWDYCGSRQCDAILRAVYRETKVLDKDRPCIDTSGNFHVETDIFDLHDYTQDTEEFQRRYGDGCLERLAENPKAFPDRQTYGNEAFFISEYGGIKWPPSEIVPESWGYGQPPETEAKFIERYRGLTDTLLDNGDCFGFCYTQLYDIEQEQNGLYYYNREPKFDMQIFREINGRKAKIEK